MHALSSFSARPSCGARDETPDLRPVCAKTASNVQPTIYAYLGNGVERFLLIKVSLIWSGERVRYA